jgi:hypothetical protein
MSQDSAAHGAAPASGAVQPLVSVIIIFQTEENSSAKPSKLFWPKATITGSCCWLMMARPIEVQQLRLSVSHLWETKFASSNNSLAQLLGIQSALALSIHS